MTSLTSKSARELDLPILVDCDGVLSDCVGAFLKLAAEKLNIFALPEDITREEIGPSIGCPSLEYMVDDEVLHREFCYQMKPIVAGVQFFKTLEDIYGPENVFVCTKPWGGDSRERATGEWASQRYAWLRDHLGVLRNRVHMSGVKRHVQGYLIDDSPKNLNGRPPEQAFCIARPYNVGYTGNRSDYTDCLQWLKETVK